MSELSSIAQKIKEGILDWIERKGYVDLSEGKSLTSREHEEINSICEARAQELWVSDEEIEKILDHREADDINEVANPPFKNDDNAEAAAQMIRDRLFEPKKRPTFQTVKNK